LARFLTIYLPPPVCQWCVGSSGAPSVSAPISLTPRLSALCLAESWQVLQRDCRLLGAKNSSRLPLWGSMWSATPAAVTLPCCWQNLHSGSILSWWSLSAFHCFVLYRCRHGLASLHLAVGYRLIKLAIHRDSWCCLAHRPCLHRRPGLPYS